MKTKNFTQTFHDVYFQTFNPYIDFGRGMTKLNTADSSDGELIKKTLYSIFKKSLHFISRTQNDIPNLFLLDIIYFYGRKVRQYSQFSKDDELTDAFQAIKNSENVGEKILSAIRYYYRAIDLILKDGIPSDFLIENGYFLDNQVLKYSVKVNEEVAL